VCADAEHDEALNCRRTRKVTSTGCYKAGLWRAYGKPASFLENPRSRTRLQGAHGARFCRPQVPYRGAASNRTLAKSRPPEIMPATRKYRKRSGPDRHPVTLKSSRCRNRIGDLVDRDDYDPTAKVSYSWSDRRYFNDQGAERAREQITLPTGFCRPS